MDCTLLFKNAQKASRAIINLEPAQINRVLFLIADMAEKEIPFLMSGNEKDLALADKDDPRYDRL